MTGDDTARLIYGVLLVTLVGSAFLAGRRENTGTLLRYGLIWAAIIGAVALGYGLLSGAL